jgi:ABC-type maltose transport system permease subunit
MNPRPWWTKLGHRTLLVLATVYCIFPIYFMLIQSLKTAQEDVFGNPLIVVNPTFENFAELFEREAEVRGFVGRVLQGFLPVHDLAGEHPRRLRGLGRLDARGQPGRRLRARPAASPGLPVVASGHLRHVRDPAHDPLRAPI